MNEEKHIPTVFDIAREAGVSRGTVDRVLHKRGRFSAETAGKVLDAVRKLGYTANPNAALLASRREWTIACLLPSFREGEYWELIHRGLDEGIPEGSNLRLLPYNYDQTNPVSFQARCRDILEDKPSGVILNSVFKDGVRTFAAELDKAGIPYAFLDNKVDGLGNAFYVGIDPYRSGELGAFLLTVKTAPEEIGLIRLIRDCGHLGDPNEPRRKGFLDYLTAHFPGIKVHTIFINPSLPEEATRVLEEFSAAHPTVRHYATTNSRIFLAAPFLKAHPAFTAVGFDDLERNLQALREGCVDFLVTHRIQEQARLCVSLFADFLLRSARPEPRNHYVHLDILHALNADSYIE